LIFDLPLTPQERLLKMSKYFRLSRFFVLFSSVAAAFAARAEHYKSKTGNAGDAAKVYDRKNRELGVITSIIRVTEGKIKSKSVRPSAMKNGTQDDWSKRSE
jgi:hypothetical protein